MNNIKWEEAPEGTTHHYQVNHLQWWIKQGGGDQYRFWLIGTNVDWSFINPGFSKLYKERLTVKPIEKQVMKLTAKDIRHTEAYKQLKHVVTHSTMAERNGTHKQDALMLLVKMFLKNVNNYRTEHKIVGKPADYWGVAMAFTWADSAERDDYWKVINNGRVPANLFPYRNKKAKPLAANPGPALIAKAPEPVKVAPKAVGWWG